MNPRKVYKRTIVVAVAVVVAVTVAVPMVALALAALKGKAVVEQARLKVVAASLVV